MYQLLSYIIIAFIVLGVVTILYTPFFFLLRKRIRPLRQISFILFFVSVLIILTATILVNVRFGLSLHVSKYFLNLVPFYWIFETYEMGFQKMIIQLISNVLLFVPFGFLLPVVFTRIRSMINTILTVFIFSLSIETFQYFIGRSADIDDLIMNVFGGIIGYIIFTLLNKALKNKDWIVQH